jgi:hypothetical protein
MRLPVEFSKGVTLIFLESTKFSRINWAGHVACIEEI